jgi:hypothetical protein
MEEERNTILAQMKKKRLEAARGSQTHRANDHTVDTYVDLDSIIECCYAWS